MYGPYKRNDNGPTPERNLRDSRYQLLSKISRIKLGIRIRKRIKKVLYIIESLIRIKRKRINLRIKKREIIRIKRRKKCARIVRIPTPIIIPKTTLLLIKSYIKNRKRKVEKSLFSIKSQTVNRIIRRKRKRMKTTRRTIRIANT
jgi:hypothetical protein